MSTPTATYIQEQFHASFNSKNIRDLTVGFRFDDMEKCHNILSRRDALALLDLIDESFSCNRAEDLAALMQHLKKLMRFEFATCLLSATEPGIGLKSYEVINVDYPSEWIELYVANGFHRVDPIVREHFTAYTLQYWEDTYRKFRPSKKFLCLAEDFGLKQGYTHGIKNLSGNEVSLFSVSGGHIERDAHAEAILYYLVPHLHNALRRIAGCKPANSGNTLSLREREVLNWFKRGKSTWETSIILGVSERTVNFHIGNIMRKLNAVSRTHAVAIAMQEELIDFD